MAKTNGTTTGKYPVEEYLTMLRLAKRSDKTIEGYRKVLKSFADFLGVPLTEIHRHLLVSNLLKYADGIKIVQPRKDSKKQDKEPRNRSDAGTKTNLSILRRYFTMNGVKFDELQYNAMKPKVNKEHNDKPLELGTIQKMMDLTDVHGRAIISFLISTGCRADETCNILLSDVSGDVVTIRNEIAKGGHGGKVYLTIEAREFMDIWLREREDYIRIADARMKPLVKKCHAKQRPVKDQRLFAISYTSLNKKWARLYDSVDGSTGKYHRENTIHSCRKFFRTAAAQGGMHPDLVTGLMRQTGYLDSTYVRMTEDEKYRQFKAKEAVLYITRADHRIQTSKLSALERELETLRQENASYQAQLNQSEQARKEKEKLDSRILERLERLEQQSTKK
jgi:integrase